MAATLCPPEELGCTAWLPSLVSQPTCCVTLCKSCLLSVCHLQTWMRMAAPRRSSQTWRGRVSSQTGGSERSPFSGQLRAGPGHSRLLPASEEKGGLGADGPGRASRPASHGRQAAQSGLGADGSEAARPPLVCASVTANWWPSEDRGVTWPLSSHGGRAASPPADVGSPVMGRSTGQTWASPSPMVSCHLRGNWGGGRRDVTNADSWVPPRTTRSEYRREVKPQNLHF